MWGDADPEPDAMEGREGLTPVFAPTTTTSRPPAGTGSTVTTAESTSTTAARAVPPGGGGGADGHRATARVTDPEGDATRASGGQPAWADLTGATLTRFDQFFELRVRFGEPAPSSSGSSDRTMNVATFFDVDGDGFVDYEVWANLADGGWDGAWFDDAAGAAALGDDAAMDVLVEHDDLVVRFPPQYVDAAVSFRWSVASEYGGYGLLGGGETARDDAPDDDQAVAFPQ